MGRFQHELPAEGLTAAEIKLKRGSVAVRGAEPGIPGIVSFDGTLEVTTRGSTLLVSQPDLDEANAEVILPATVRNLRCATGHGELRIEDVQADVRATTGWGDVILAHSRGAVKAETGLGAVTVSAWLGPLTLASGAGRILVEGAEEDVKATTGKGDITIREAEGRVEARTGMGHLVAAGLTGDTTLQTGKGDILVTEIDGARVEVQTGRGAIALSGRLAGLKARTGAGEIVCRCALGAGAYDVKSGHGDVTLDLPVDAELRVDATTRHGHIESNLPLVKVGGYGPEGYFGRRLVGAVGHADEAHQSHVLITAGHGDIRIFRQAGVAPTAPATDARSVAASVRDGRADPTGSTTDAQSAEAELVDTSPAPPGAAPQPAPDPDDSTESPGEAPAEDPALAILEAVSRGEVSVEEALALLRK